MKNKIHKIPLIVIFLSCALKSSIFSSFAVVPIVCLCNKPLIMTHYVDSFHWHRLRTVQKHQKTFEYAPIRVRIWEFKLWKK